MSNIFQEAAYQDFFKELKHAQNLLAPWYEQKVGKISSEFNQNTEFSLSLPAQKIFHKTIEPIFGENLAKLAVQKFNSYSRVLCMHHLGVECMAEQVQIVHFFYLQQLINNANNPEKHNVLPILACSAVPLQSYSYPRGLMPARISEQHKLHAPLFPSALQNTLVYHAPKFEKKKVLEVCSKWNRKLFLDYEWEVMNEIVHNVILSPDCLNLPDLNSQLMLINDQIFHLIYKDNPTTHVTYLNLESISSELIKHDLENKDSILYKLYFDENARKSILHKLLNERGCWSLNAVNGEELHRCGNNGSIFFWASDEKGRRLPLSFRQNPDRLFYKDLSIDLNPESLILALDKKIIYPSLFSSFVSLHLEHKLMCYGGLYMADYLPKMLKAVSQTLTETEYGEFLDLSNFNSFGTGVFSCQIQVEEDLYPAGSIELIHKNGITKHHLEQIADLNYKDTLPLALKDWSLYFTDPSIQTKDWLKNLDEATKKWKGIIL